MVGPLVEDVNESLQYLFGDEKTQFWRRTHVRAVFALIEGWLNSMRLLVLGHVEVGLVKLPVGDVALLRENRFDLDKRGDLVVSQAFAPFEKTFNFIFRCLATTLETGYKLDRSTQDWQYFKAALAVRNRITHPRVASELSVTDEEMTDVEGAMDWFRVVSIAVAQKPQNDT